MSLLLRFWPVLALGALALLVWWAFGAYNRAQQTIGENKVVIEQQQETLDEVETAQEARTEIATPGSSAKYCQCLRSSRGGPTPCERYMPDSIKDFDKPASVCEG